MAGSGTAPLRPQQALLSVEHLVVEYGAVKAVSDVSFDVARGETLGLVGESGCGKSTLGRAILQLTSPKSGSVVFGDIDLVAQRGRRMRALRRRLQLIFQDPIASLNPRRRVGDIIAEALVIHRVTDRAERERRVREILEAVGLHPERVLDRLPHEFSGGQCQRIAIARALVLAPELVVCDEPVSALDVSIRAQVLNLLEEMKARFGLTLIFISHDLAVVKTVSDRVAVMYLGKLCEIGETTSIFRGPAHPYTALLLSAIPRPDPDVPPARMPPVGEMPSPMRPPSGCRFRTRCPRADAQCAAAEPVMRAVGPDHFVACHHPLTGQP
ncbi:MAG: ABC transporter ATP-binding protein [Sulfurifustaceae bacterium]